ncbi:hypothetical protein HY212_03685 [Candidatus Pacearchaeota archaeon]|nr:hypothetical protein [Candidatus Pacearchaeota archaeon]
MKKSLSKTEVDKIVEEFFKEIKSKNPKDVKKIKRLSMSYKIKLGEKRKDFCKKCLMPYVNSKIRINGKNKIIICDSCGNISRWKMGD